MKKVLIISYYWPPAGGIEVHRVVKFAKYLSSFGYEPMVLTVEGGTASASDPALCAEVADVAPVVKAPSREPHHLFYALTGKKQPQPSPEAKSTPQAPSAREPARSRAHTLGEFIRLNVFIPDARIGWYPAAVRAGKDLIRTTRPDLIFSTAPPYTVHLIAAKLAKTFNIPWVADFRDPWVENYAYNTQYRFPWVRWFNERMERRVLNRADRVVVATPGQQILQGAKARDGEAKFLTLTNGHDFSELPDPVPSRYFYLSYFGSLSAQRVPEALFDTLAEMLRDDAAFAADFRFRFAGRITPEARKQITERLPEANCECHPMLPHHAYREKVIEHQVLLVFVDQVPHNDMILPAKCLEMITTGNPMLAFGPRGGDVDRFLSQHHGGHLVPFDNAPAIRSAIHQFWEHWRAGTLNQGARPVPELHRRQLTQRLAALFDELLPPSGAD